MKFTSLLTVILLCMLPVHFSFSQMEQNMFISGKCTVANSLNPTFVGSTSATVAAGRSSFLSTFFTFRTHLEFDVSGIPPEAIITNATLKLYREGASTGSPVIYTARITEAWDENTLTWSNQPDYETIDQVTTTNFDIFGWMNVNVTNHVQKMVCNVYTNHGWMLYHNNETENADKFYTFRSDDYADPASHPRLQVSYYIPMSVTNAVITHESVSGASDGSISPVLVNGPGGTYTYQWYNKNGVMSGKTALNLTGVPYGWYGLRVTSSIAGTEPFYYAFLVGENCAVREIEFNPGPDFIDDAVLRSNPSNTDQFNNFHNTALLSMSYSYPSVRSSVLKFRLWIDEGVKLSQADLFLMAKSASASNLSNPNNSGRMYLLQSNWNEKMITFSNCPNYLSTGFIPVPTLLNIPQLCTFNALSSFESWQQNNAENFGWFIHSNSSGRLFNIQEFHSSDTTVSRPKVNFKVGSSNPIAPHYCNQSFAKTERSLRGVRYKPYMGYLYFYYDEEYIPSGQGLNYKVYKDNNPLTTVLDPVIQPLTEIEYGDNRYVLKTTSLSVGFYVLEITNNKQEKFYLRFKVEN